MRQLCFFMVKFAKRLYQMEELLNIDGLFGYLYYINNVLAVLIMVHVVLDNRNPIRTLAWIMVLLFIPFLGLVLYFFFGRDTKKLKYINRRSLSRIQQRSHLYYRSQNKVTPPVEYSHLATYLENTASAYPMAGNKVRVIGSVESFIDELLSAIAAAKEHIHLQFYIFEDDRLGTCVRDALIAKAREGVEVRVIYDSVGCLGVSHSFFDEITIAGGHVEAFLKVWFPILGDRVNYRNHRKVVVIDGKLGYIGGCNIADRYVSGTETGCWRDTMLAIQGCAVYGLQTSFLIDWYFATNSLVSGKRYFPPIEQHGDAMLQVAQSNPVGGNRVIMSALIMLLGAARKYVYIQTPYLALTDPMILAIRNAALSGVDVRLMIPFRSDSRISDFASFSYLGTLLEAGVRVYLFKGGMLHCKTVVSDDKVSSAGSANFDFRSFYYNFEVNALVYDEAVACEMRALFIADEKSCVQLTEQNYEARSFARRCAESAARLFSPIL